MLLSFWLSKNGGILMRHTRVIPRTTPSATKMRGFRLQHDWPHLPPFPFSHPHIRPEGSIRSLRSESLPRFVQIPLVSCCGWRRSIYFAAVATDEPLHAPVRGLSTNIWRLSSMLAGFCPLGCPKNHPQGVRALWPTTRQLGARHGVGQCGQGGSQGAVLLWVSS